VAKRKTGLGIDAFFPEAGNKESILEKKAPPPPKISLQERPRSPKAEIPRKSTKPVRKAKSSGGDMNERRPAWIRLDHLERLDALKHRERKRLRREAKRVSRSTLIDEAIERYLLEMEK
jgi:hypothetical protein